MLVRRAAGESLMLGLGAAVGLGTGMLAAALIGSIRLVQGVAFPASPNPVWTVAALTIGGLLVGLVVTYLVPESSGSGVIAVMRTLALRGGRFRGRVPPGGIAASALALGTGASGGREGPIVLIGGSFGSLLGRAFAVGEERMRTLVAAGAAAGIGASFNAPIGGMLFAIELLVGGFSARSPQVIVVASVVGSVTARQLIGPDIIYEPDVAYRLGDPRELLLYAVLGLAAAVFGIVFLYGEDLGKRVFAGLRLWRPLRLALAGLGVGLIALAVPEVIGTGDRLPPVGGLRDPIQFMLNGGFESGYAAAGILLLLAVAKLVATCLSIGSGSAVGTFAPILFCGAALGGALGTAAAVLLPGAQVQPGAFALVGMAALFSAAARAPLTAILIVFELTGDYELVLPLMLAAGIATFLADRLQSESVYTYPLRRLGILFAEPQDVDIMQTVRVGEIMTTDPHAVPADLPLDQLQHAFNATRSHGFPVTDGDDRLVGIVTVTDLAAASRVDEADVLEVDLTRGERLTAGDICTRQPLTVTPADPVFRALRRMAAADVGRLPVVSNEDHSRLVGLLRRVDVVKAYQRALTRSLGVQQRKQSSQLRDLVGAQFVELVVDDRADVAGLAVRDIDWPARTILTSIRRDGALVMPRGDTLLHPGDEVVVLTGSDSIPLVRRLIAPAETGTAADGGG